MKLESAKPSAKKSVAKSTKSGGRSTSKKAALKTPVVEIEEDDEEKNVSGDREPPSTPKVSRKGYEESSV